MDRERDSLGRYTTIHGGRRSRLYGVWCNMKERCYNPHNKSYERYGGRGISMCQSWKDSFASFQSWALSHGYEENLTIDRIDNEGNYEPFNCRWVTQARQNRNYSRNHFITYNGKTQCLADWADEYGIKQATVLFRIKAGKPLDEVFMQGDGRSRRWEKKHSKNCTK